MNFSKKNHDFKKTTIAMSKTIKLVVLLLITAFMFNSCTEEEIQKNSYPYGQDVYNQAAYTKLQVLTYVKDSYLEEYGDDYEVVQELEREEEKLVEFMVRIESMARVIGPLPGGGIGPIPRPIPCDVSPDFNVLSEFDGLDGDEILNKIDKVAIGLSCIPLTNLSNLGIVIEGFQEVDSSIYTPDGELVGVVVDYTEDVFGQQVLKYGTEAYSGEVIVTNDIIIEGGIRVNVSYPAYID